jgi:4-hydroxy-2-oxoheptanedioate aldolase
VDKIRAKIAQGQTVFGSWVAIGNTVSAELLGQAGYDWLCIDTQHGGIAGEGLLLMLQAISISGTPALVRVPWTDQAQIMRALDLGAAGVVVPMVSTGEQAKLAADACRYPPKGIRSFGPVRSYYAPDGTVADPICLVMVETAEAMQNLDAIASTPGVDGILIGPADLALSLGYGLQFKMLPEIFAAYDKIIAACKRHKIICASAALSLENAGELMKRGIQMLGVGADSLFIRRGAAEDLAQLKKWRGDA